MKDDEDENYTTAKEVVALVAWFNDRNLFWLKLLL